MRWFVCCKNHKRHITSNFFFTIKSPITTSDKNISIYERIRIGGGFNFYYDNKNNIEFYISYNTLLIPNKNGWRKGITFFCKNKKLCNKAYVGISEKKKQNE